MMKQLRDIRITVTAQQFQDLLDAKGNQTWAELILSLIPVNFYRIDEDGVAYINKGVLTANILTTPDVIVKGDKILFNRKKFDVISVVNQFENEKFYAYRGILKEVKHE